MTRTPLPNRRDHEAFHFYHWDQKFIAGIGRAVPFAPISEVWINTGKTGTQAETLARDSAVLLSLALQHGTPIKTMQKAITRNADGTPSGPIGHLLDLIAQSQQDGEDEAPEGQPSVPDRPRAGSDAVELTV
jgi:hypothetical protein